MNKTSGPDAVRETQRAKARGLLDKMTQARFVLNLHLLLDVLSELKKLSLLLQKKDSSPADLAQMLDDLIATLERYKTR